MKRTPSILEEAFPIAPTCLSLVNMDETDIAQLRQRMAISRRILRSLKGYTRLISSDTGAGALWFLQWNSKPIETGGLDAQQKDASMHLHHPSQDGIRSFRLEADVAMPRLATDEQGAEKAIETILDVYEAILELPHGGLDGSPEAVSVAARRATSIVSALHAADGRSTPGTCVYVPRTPWHPAEIVRHKSEGGGAFLRKRAASAILADDPVCVSLSKSEDWYHVKGTPKRHLLTGALDDTVKTLRLLASIDPSIAPSRALVRRRGETS